MKQVLVFLTDGFADWEASYVCAELNNPQSGYEIKTIAVDLEPKTSMGGLKVLPDYAASGSEWRQLDVAMLILPGGTGWNDPINEQAKDTIRQCLDLEAGIAAICDATTFLGRHGFLEEHKHTGNMLVNLKHGAPDYRGDILYVDAQAVADGPLITANGSAAVEFAKLILEKLGVYQGEALEQWYDVFKKGYLQDFTEIRAC
ncbi:glutamine amidotransferase [Paenibacillus alkaliterrae]|uniref:type 1 glutamine amidotransferase family protein n=1 Tax=Paenibacillus alkaliterrae TaxID=320909 RepID=UPI001F44C17E|nr:type 1 glutamine amidotransferase family protein [Paenibacillus alkaliterrae]MCF2941910.1 glutamine amidotransferase [Paenibacillus alkaliterrae]